MSRNGLPDGGRYTRPRRGFRTKSHYRDRLRKRGLSRENVRMESLYVLRERQGYVSRPTDGIGRKRPAYSAIRRTYSGVSVPRGLPKMASYYSSPDRAENTPVE